MGLKIRRTILVDIIVPNNIPFKPIILTRIIENNKFNILSKIDKLISEKYPAHSLYNSIPHLDISKNEIIENNKQIPVYGNGLQVRDWIHAEDHSSAIYTILEKGSISEIYNISGDTLISNIDLINLIIKEKNAFTNLITHVKDRINHDVLYHVNDSKIRALGWKPIHNIKNEINSL